MEDRDLVPLVLGTAQLGMNYGVANKVGKPDLREAVEIVRVAWESGVRFFDTAQAYGNSEKVLGVCFRELGLCRDARLHVNTKLDPSLDLADKKTVLDRVDGSLRELGISRLWSVMLHRESLLSGPVEDLAAALKQTGRSENFGASVYSAEKALFALGKDEIDSIQLPFNIFDQRALEADLFALAAARRKHLLVRSVFLQGLLLLNDGQIPAALEFSKEALKILHRSAEEIRIPIRLLCLAFVVQNANDSLVIIGAETPGQVEENVRLYRESRNLHLPDLSFLSQRNPKMIDPSEWFH